MNARAEAASSGLDTVKLAAAALLLAVGIWAFYFFDDYSVLLRTLGLLVIALGFATRPLWHPDYRVQVVVEEVRRGSPQPLTPAMDRFELGVIARGNLPK